MTDPRFERFAKPRYLWIETSDRCNLRCTMCDRTAALAALASEGGLMAMDLVEKILAYLEPEMTVSIGGFGEPFLHPEYSTILRRVKQIGCRTISYSNGLLIDDRTAEALVTYGLDDLSISIDGATNATYEAIRGAPLDRLRERIERLTAVRREHNATAPTLTLQMVGMKDNIHEAAALVRFAKETGADAVTIINLACNIPETKPQSLFLHPALWKKHFEEARIEADRLSIPLTLPEMGPAKGSCHGFFRDMFILWDGLVSPCGVERYILGDVSVDSIESVWNGEAYEHYRRRWEQEGPAAVCTNCLRLTNDKEAWIHPPRPTEPVRLATRRKRSQTASPS